MTDVFIVSGVRTAIGAFGGSLKDTAPSELGVATAREAITRAGVAADAIGHAVYGQVLPSEPRDAYMARIIAIESGLPVETPALTVNRLCGSGLQAIVSAAQALLLGDCEVALAGGAESMSRTPFYLPTHRWGRKLGDAVLVDGLNEGLKDPFNGVLMGITAENIAERHGIARARQDAFALESHRRAADAIAEGRFDDQIVPVKVGRRGRETEFRTDEHVRANVTAQDLAALRPVFKPDGSVTAGNASGINDGAASLVLATGAAVARHGLRPLARLVAYAHAGVEPLYMGMGPVPAVQVVLARAGLSVDDLDVIESNEAFAAQCCAVSDALGLDPAKVNPNGSGIALGHPVGATGAIITVKLVHELQRRGGRYGLATMCIGGGQGIAAVFERC
ncbi:MULTISPECIES: beta-ketothiolase BktB [Stenotrophomonas]|uniref:Acetyl-CoA acetyltransferase n=1 Tax=Stenotrophomonas nitritireducens TaxID=83617 RepID=A0ABR5NLI2_9GAMM|nr:MULTISPECIES: beta-ketothiolase BktB [Stenotrophomonas]KQN96588.1 acetyl-CoA acetyltransferase [Stenotrophomonas sp. Leaf70]KRG58752.1 acetyl-CoA acetyltransferase [Stenotrophomonas nitritireducens]